MTTIFKVSEQEHITPAFEHVERELIASTDEVTPPPVLDDNSLIGEMERIEKCAADGNNYAYNPKWSPEHVAQLREYAVVCGMKSKMLPANPKVDQPEVQDDPSMKRLADAVTTNKPSVPAELSRAVGDPFLLADKSDGSAKKTKWETVTAERKLNDQPDLNFASGSIASIRGEYEYESSPSLRVRRGENSMTEPDAIGKLAKGQDNGERLKAENLQLKQERKSAKTAWQKEAVKTAKDLGAGALPRGKVFMTGSIPEPQQTSGLDLKLALDEFSQINSPFIKNEDLPKLTEGEKLNVSNCDRKSAIQRKANKDDWEKVKGTTKPTLTDEFSDALEAHLKNAGIVDKA